jgi:glycosyltransferase involved in cell wall biosynthesis
VEFLGARRNWCESDAVVIGLLGTCPDLYFELLKKPLSGRRVGVWGHIKSYVNKGNPIDLFLESLQMRASDHVFAYTPSGSEYAHSRGIDRAKITTVMNSVDVDPLLASVDELTDEEVDEFANRHGLIPGKTFAYLGGLDSSKRVDLLADALDLMWARDPQVKVLVGGRGTDESLLASHIAREQVIHLGYAGTEEKAMMSRVAESILNPGRVGLLAVEALALGLPVLTTDWPFNAPEFEYLDNGKSVFTSKPDSESFAKLVLESTSPQKESRSGGIRRGWSYPTIDDMVDNFASGIRSMVDR